MLLSRITVTQIDIWLVSPITDILKVKNDGDLVDQQGYEPKNDILNGLTPIGLGPDDASLPQNITATELKPAMLDQKRLESPCSNSSDSGLSDINNSLTLNASGLDANDPLRPRIWSLAHVATSTPSATTSANLNSKDQNLPLNFSKVGSSFMPTTTSTMRPWMDNSFSLGSTMLSGSSNGYTSLSSGGSTGSNGDKTSPLGVSPFNGLSAAGNSSLLRPYPSLSSLYSPARDMGSRGNDRMTNPIGWY